MPTKSASKKDSKRNHEVVEWLKLLWVPIAGLIGTVTLVVQFVNLWQDSPTTVSTVVIALILGIIVAASIYMGFTTRKKWSKEDRKYHFTSRFPQYHKYARILLVVIVVAGTLFVTKTYVRIQQLEEKVVILVANFDGSEPQKYRITEELLLGLRNSLNNYDDVTVLPLDRVITEQEGSEVARSLAKRYRADIIVWGYYGITDTSAKVYIHLENLSPVIADSIQTSSSSAIQVPIEEMNSFIIQQNLADQMTALTFFISGIARFKASDNEEALERFDKSLEALEWEDQLVSKAYVLDYKGLTLGNLERYLEAVSQSDMAIELNSDVPEFYIHRAYWNRALHKYVEALNDLNTALVVDPENADAYVGKATIYLLQAFDQPSFPNEVDQNLLDKAFHESEQAISIDTQNEDAYATRAYVFQIRKEYPAALNDLNTVIALNPKHPLIYATRGAVYQTMGDYDNALRDFDRSISLDKNGIEIAYFGRALTYISLGERDKAISDLKYVMEITESLDMKNQAEFWLSNLGVKP